MEGREKAIGEFVLFLLIEGFSNSHFLTENLVKVVL